MSTESAITIERRQQVQAALSDIQALLGSGSATGPATGPVSGIASGPVTREQLAAVTARLEQLAERQALFPVSDFPPPAAGQGVGASTRYRLNPDDAPGVPALYLNSINPGKTTLPHNHTTWAVIVALAGQELNRVYRRSDDGTQEGRATLEQVREVVVQPGQSVSFLPDDIHSIHVTGDAPTLHFHLYGQPLETLSGRIGIDLATGQILNYNATQMKPGQEVRA